jgi:hypothetical protein
VSHEVLAVIAGGGSFISNVLGRPSRLRWAIAWSRVVSLAPSFSTIDRVICQPRGKLISRPRGVTVISNPAA